MAFAQSQQFPVPELVPQPLHVALTPTQDVRFSQNYQEGIYGSTHPDSALASPPAYSQAPFGQPAGIAELPTAQPPAPLTSTPAEQLSGDEALAHKLQQMEIKEANGVAHNNILNESPSQASLHSSTSRSTQQLTPQLSVSHPTGRPQSHSVSSQFRPESFIQASQLQLSPNASPEDLAPEVDMRPHSYSVTSQPKSESFIQAAQLQLSSNARPEDLAPEVVIERNPSYSMPIPVTPIHPTAHLPPLPMNSKSLSAYLEQHRQVPYPPQWALRPIIETYHSTFQHVPKSDWLDPLDQQLWHISRAADTQKTVPPAFRLSFKTHGGQIRNPRFSWNMTTPPKINSKGKPEREKTSWVYNLKLDMRTNMKAEETLMAPNGRYVLCAYVHASNYDSLKFIAPDGRAYKWVSHTCISSLNGNRYDAIRHALFRSTQRGTKQDPLYGEIVADHCYWDGHIDASEEHNGIRCNGCDAKPLTGLRWKCRHCRDHDVCESCRLSGKSVNPKCEFTLVSLPDESLYIRTTDVDVSMVVATLQVMKDSEKMTLREERRKHSTSFSACVEQIRMSDLGRMSYWRSSDFEGKDASDMVHGTLIASRAQKRE